MCNISNIVLGKNDFTNEYYGKLDAQLPEKISDEEIYLAIEEGKAEIAMRMIFKSLIYR
ncbi:MAG: hypothetical protein NC430_10705 [bacterium]|nr:hypothetical protein [bacterium]MCM1423665.1 hypothetical protein [bacterium]